MKKKSYNFESNAPVVSKDYMPFANTLDEVLKNPNNKNIGVIGSFGSGKSSAIKTFEKRNKKRLFFGWKTINVTLGKYLEKSDPSSSDTEEDLQSAIVQQIIYSVPRYKVPASSVRKKGFKISHCLMIIFAICLSLFLCLKNPEAFKFLESKITNVKTWMVDGGIILSSVLFLIYFFVSFPITSITAKIKNVEIKSEPSNEKNVFCEYIEELIYFFRKTKTRVVIFEDIDRINIKSNSLFTKLHNLNSTINNCTYFRRHNHTVRFIYCVKEDIFISSEGKSKFFDVLLSIPQVLTASNSEKRLLELINKNDLYVINDDLFTMFYQDVKNYRQMKNIINSYLAFSFNKDLGKNESNNLLALIIYKSEFPEDYTLFLKNKGVLSYLLSKQTPKTLTGYRGSKYYLDEKDNSCNFEVNEAIFTSINEFCTKYDKYISSESIYYVSSFVSNSSQDFNTDLFYLRISKGKPSFDIEHKYNNAKNILNDERASKNIISDQFLNLSLITLMETKKYHHLYLRLCESFQAELSPNKIKFVEYLIEHQIDDKYSIDLLRFLILNVPGVLAKISSSIILNNSTFLFSKIFTSDLYNKYAEKRSIIDLFNKLIKQNTTITSMDKSLLILLIKDGAKIHKIHNNKMMTQELIDCVLDNLGFVPSGENFKTLLILKKFIIPSNSLFKNLHAMGGEKIISYFISSISGENFKDYSDLVCDFSDDDVNNVSFAFSEFKAPNNFIDVLMDRLPVLIFSKKYMYKELVLAQLFKSNKLSATITDFAQMIITYPFPDIKKNVIKMILENSDLLLPSSEKDKENPSQLVYEVLNDVLCKYEISGVIMEKTCSSYSLDVGKITNTESLKCAFDYKYLKLDQNTISKFSTSLEEFSEFYGKYKDKILNDVKVLNLLPDQIKMILEIDKTIDTVNSLIEYRTTLPYTSIFNLIIDNVEKCDEKIIEEALFSNKLSVQDCLGLCEKINDKISDEWLYRILKNYSSIISLDGERYYSTNLDFLQRLKDNCPKDLLIIKRYYIGYITIKRK